VKLPADAGVDAIAVTAMTVAARLSLSVPEALVKGGVIVAWGATDIYDPLSELHQRYEISVTTSRFHSIDPGKLTMAPYFAEECAGRILCST